MKKLSENAKLILERFLAKDIKGRIIETPEEMFLRVAKNIAAIDKKYGENAKKSEKEFFSVMSNLEFLPNIPALANAGRPLQQLAACFVIPIEDDLGKIFQAVKEMALIQKSGGGVGFSFSRLRPEGSIVADTGGVASGPVSFMKVFDVATGAIKEGGIRRGANMGILSVEHPDIEKFINAKKTGDFTNFNISVAITDKFMNAVLKNKTYPLIDLHTNKILVEKKARLIFDLICQNTHHNGEPGIIFIDTINKFNPMPKEKIEATNPCLTKDTWVLTEKGPSQIKELINKNTSIASSGKFYNSIGFFPTGSKEIFKIETKRGYEVKATNNHLFSVAKKITRHKTERQWKQLKDLKKGDFIIIGSNRGLKWKGNGSFEEGYLLGLLVGDGFFSENRGVISVWKRDKGGYSMIPEVEKVVKKLFKLRKDFSGFQKENRGRRELKLKAIKEVADKFKLGRNKNITEVLEKTSHEFYCGFLRGFFDTDGSVQGNLRKGISIRLWQNNLENLKVVQRMLQRLGIISSLFVKRKKKGKHLMPNGKGGKKYYISNEGHELIISEDNILTFSEKIGFSNEEKRNKLMTILKSYKRKLNRERFIDKIKTIEKIKVEEVFDVNVPEINCFDANGFIVHNCGEQPLLPYESCILGSINLSAITSNKLDYTKLDELVKIGAHFLDNALDASKFPIQQITKKIQLNRKIGLGIMGFADCLIKQNISYNSKEAINEAAKIMSFIQEKAKSASRKLAESRGSFPNINNSIYKGMKMRNATLTTIAPTGTIGIIADCSDGIEPLFNVIFQRYSTYGLLTEFNPLFKEIAERYNLSRKELLDIAGKGTIKHTKLPEQIKKIFVSAHDIGIEQHVKVQAAFQQHVDNAVSKTVNLPNHATINDIKKTFLLAYRLGCKGLTIYRDKSRKLQVLRLCKCKLQA